MDPDARLPRSEIAHVLFMDLVGYSLQPIDLQTELLNCLQKIVRESTAFQLGSTQNQLIVLPTGDGMALVFFDDPAAPVKCGLEIARSLQDNLNIRLRIGIHMGPVSRHLDIKDQLNVVGGGINVAQRVMDCGDAGHILLSSNIVEMLGQYSSWMGCFRDLGVLKVKHGVTVHLYRLCKDGLGNPKRPKKIKRRLYATLLKVLLVVTLPAGLGAILWWNNANNQLSKKVALKAIDILDRNPELHNVALQLARAALSKSRTPEAREALFRSAVAAGRIQTGLGSCSRITFSSDGDRLATAGGDGIVRIWRLSDRTETRSPIQFRGGGEIRAIAFNNDSTRLAVAGPRGQAEVWDPRSASAKALLDLPVHDETIMDAAFCPKHVLTDIGCLATASFDGIAKLWAPMSGQLIRELPTLHKGVVKIAFAKDGSRLAVIAKDGDVMVWDMLAERIVSHFSAIAGQEADGSLQEANDSLGALSFSSDGTLLATASERGRIRFWNLGGHLMKEAEWPGAVFRVLSFQPNNGQKLVTIDADGRAILWNMNGTPSPLWLPRDAGKLRDAAFSPNGACLALAEDNGNVLLYYMRDPELEKYAKSIVTRDLQDDECRAYLGLSDCRELH